MKKTCNRCNKTFSLQSGFHKNPTGKDGYINQCKNCILLAHQIYRSRNLEVLKEKRKKLYWQYREDAIRRAVEWGRKNKEKRKVAKDRWRAKNKPLTNHYAKNYSYRNKGAEGSHSMKEWKDKLEEFGGFCAYCKIRRAGTRDHIIALSKGGTNYISNIIPACVNCNSSKRDKTVVEWRRAVNVVGFIHD